MGNYIYFDNNATTQLAPKVLKEMLFDLKSDPYNPSSSHFLGRKAHSYLTAKRKKIASLFKVNQDEIIFTSGGSESLNMMIKGALSKNDHIISTDIEHSAVYNTLKKKDNVTFLKTGLKGAVNPCDIKNAIKKNTKLIVISAVNSETGVETDIDSIALLAKENNIHFIVD
ncbi:unnamed protein product, partial [marine sediment metagenome]